MRKFEERMKGVLPPEELPLFFRALEEMGARPRKSLRLRRDLALESAEKWVPEKLRSVGIPLEEAVAWYPRGHFFDLKKMDPHPSRHPAVAAGLVFIQEAEAMEVAPALEVAPDHLVLDLCAAPGAKSTHIGEYLGTAGWLVANEPVRDRAKLLDAILARHGIGNSTVFNLEPHRLAERFPAVFDRVLVDAPCSGESLFAKRDEKRKDVTHKEVERCALRQWAILESAWRMTAPGGRLVYSTCAYSRIENEEVVAAFAARHGDARPILERRRFPHRDGVAGGYFAVLERAGEGSGAAEDRRVLLREGIRAIGSRGLVRDGIFRWDGAIDAYAELMDRKGIAARGEAVPIAFSLAEAARWLGEGVGEIPERKSVYAWDGERFAGASAGKAVYPRGRLR